MSSQLEEFAYQMLLIRYTETALLKLYSQGKVSGTVHTCLGQEACAVGVVGALDRQTDLLYSNHRGHGHYLAYSGDVRGLVAEVLGRPDGIVGGVGGSQHLQHQNFYSNGIQGAGVPVVAGMALAEKMKNSGAIATVFLGDGTFGEGVVYEAMNVAALWRLPMLFVVEHNGYAQSTPAKNQHAGVLAERAEPFGIRVTVEDGMDVSRVHDAARGVVERIRADSFPGMLFLNTYRFGPHSKGDDTRDPEEIAQHRTRDPIPKIERVVEPAAWARLNATASKLVDDTVRELTAS